jgi:anthranilate phosphoribosyltransferase
MEDSQKIQDSLWKNNICFMFAPLYHESFKAVNHVRKSLGVPTIFNFLGPLLNPANAQYQLIGTSRKETMLPMIHVLKEFGSKKAFVVHGFDNMDEITVSDNSFLIRLENNKIGNQEIINPEEFGIKKTSLEEIKGGDAKFNAKKIIDLLDGNKSAYFDIVVLNAAFALMAANKVKTVKGGIDLATNSIESGGAKEILNKLRN